MNIVQLTPGAGGMYCGNCFRDNALVAALRQLGHPTVLVPLYLPLRLDEPDQSAGTPVFFGGVNVYLEQKAAFFRSAPRWLHDLLSAPALLDWTARFAAKTRPEDVGELALSMLRGEQGHQARELQDLIAWLKTRPRPDVVCLSNAMLVGVVRQLKLELGTTVVCTLQGEEAYLDSLPEAWRGEVWRTLAERAQEADLFIAPSRFFGDRMAARLGLLPERVRVVFNGINLAGYPPGPSPRKTGGPVLGFFTRMCREKGLDTLVEAFILVRQRGRLPGLRLRVGGGCGPGDEPFVAALRDQLRARGLLGDVDFCPNLDRAGKIAFLRSLDAFSAPALYGEAFGLYVIEALAAGVPVVQPRHGAFPELLEATGGGRLCEPGSPEALADALESLLLDPARCRAIGAAGQAAVRANFSAEAMASRMIQCFQEAVGARPAPARPVAA